MKAIKAITLSLGDLGGAIISRYQVGLILSRIYIDKTYNGEPINLQKNVAERADFNKYLALLLEEGILSAHKTLPGVFTLIGNSGGEPEDVACVIDPFCYMSHLSAMSYHGLTDRIPGKLFISSPPAKIWRSFAKERMQKDLGESFDGYCLSNLPLLVKPKIQKINKIEVHCLSSKHLGAYKNVRGRPLRVATMGRTFLEMLRNPDLCGGMSHVIDIFEEYGKKYLRLITDDIDANGSPIDRVRAGYILDELMGIDNDIVESWSSLAQRGGSRKLDPSTEYVAEWSDKWKISLNVLRNNTG